MVPLLLFPGLAQAASVSAILGANFTLTGVDGVARPGFGLSLAAQVLPVSDCGPFCPTIGLVAHRRWLGGGHRRWMLGGRAGLSVLQTDIEVLTGFQSEALHADWGSGEGEFGVRLSNEAAPAGYGGVHFTFPAIAGVGFDSEFVPRGDRHATGYVGLQLPIPPVLAIEGRPFRVVGGHQLPAVIAVAGADRSWLARGREELASVATFARLASELRALAAPRGLVQRARRAAVEEFHHASTCFALAGGAVAAPLRWSARRFESAESARWVLGHEGLCDGAENESRAASGFERRCQRAPDDVIAGTMARIARDERAHAELGHDIARWCGVAA